MAEPALEFDAVTTLDDHAAMYLYACRRPRQLFSIALLAAAAFAWYTATLMIQNVFNAVDSLGDLADRGAIESYMDARGWSDLTSTMTMVGAWVAGFFALVVLVLHPIQARAYARRLLRERPDIDSSDRKLSQRNHCQLDADGYKWSVRDTSSRFGWPHFTRLVETRRHLFMMSSPMQGVIFPKHAMDRSLVDAVRAFADTHIVRSDNAGR